jgi:hypothetical protein
MFLFIFFLPPLFRSIFFSLTLEFWRRHSIFSRVKSTTSFWKMLEAPADLAKMCSCVVVEHGGEWSAHFVRPGIRCSYLCLKLCTGEALKRFVETAPMDFDLLEIRGSELLPQSSSSSFFYCPGDSQLPVLLSISVPKEVYYASVVVCSGPSGESAALLHALLNRPVLAGCVFTCPSGTYTIVSVEQTRGYKGLALVVPSTRIKVNVRHELQIAVQGRPPLFGVDQQRTLVDAFLRGCPNRSGLLLQGPRGCGLMSVLRETTRRLGMQLLHPDALLTSDALTASTVLLLDDLDEWSAVDETALLHHRSSVLRTLARWRRACRLVGVSRCSGVAPVLASMFGATVRFDAPDASVRAQIIASVRSCPVEDCASEAAEMVGLSAAAVAQKALAGPSTSHADGWALLGGLAEVKHMLQRDLVLPRRHPATFERFGLKPPRGVLLHGPPGCGKTSIVKALCAEGLMTFIYLDSASVISAYVGETEKAIRDAFAYARAKAPSLIFFDEVDAIGRSRALDQNDENSARLLATLLTEMDGFGATDDVCFVGATNLPHLLDSALTRPGRFDRLVSVPLPSEAERVDIVRTVLGDHPLSSQSSVEAAARLMSGFSSADVVGACREALLQRIIES